MSKTQYYTAAQACRLKLIKKADGKPFKTEQSLRNFLNRNGIKKTGVRDNGQPTYTLTMGQINKLNKR